VVLSCKRFLSQRLHEDQKCCIDRMNKFIDGKSSTEIIQAVRIHIENLFGEHSVSSFTDDVISLCAAEKFPTSLECIYYHRTALVQKEQSRFARR